MACISFTVTLYSLNRLQIRQVVFMEIIAPTNACTLVTCVISQAMGRFFCIKLLLPVPDVAPCRACAIVKRRPFFKSSFSICWVWVWVWV